MNDYAMILQNVGRANDAVPIFRDALERSRRTCGDDHPLTGILLHNLWYRPGEPGPIRRRLKNFTGRRSSFAVASTAPTTS